MARLVHTLYVSPDGLDAWSGRLPEPNARRADGPFATLERARDAVRELKRSRGLPPDGVTVHLRGGRYFLRNSFELGSEDSGTEDAPVTYRAHEKEKVRLIGGVQIEGLEPVTDPQVLRRLDETAQRNVLRTDLRAQGIVDYGEYGPRGHGGGSSVAALELFYNGRPMTVARWPKKSPLPNLGFEPVKEARGDRIVYTSDRPKRWASCDDVYLHGYFALDWASNIVGVVSLDTETREIETDPLRTGHYGVRAGGRFFYFHVLEELGEPGEWYLDRKTGILYFWPPEGIECGEAIVSIVETPLVRMQEVEHVTIRGLTVECTRGDGVGIVGGRHVTIAGCELRSIGKDAVHMEGGFHHLVTGCDIHETGECGVSIEAGDRKSLTPCNHHVHNCHIHHVAREGWTYFPAVGLRGCGALVTHNRMHDHRHDLMFFWGNDHLIEYNEFYNFTLEGDDCGCMYLGRDFTFQGNRVRHNYIHHAGDSGRNDWGSSGVYMDDCGGGTEVYGNVFHCVNKGVLAGGGINTRIRNNIFVNCSPAVWFDERGASARPGPDSMVHGVMRERFYEVGADTPPYTERYPLMDMVHEAFRNGTGVLAMGGCVANNIVVGSREPWLSTHWAVYPDYFDARDNMVNEDPHFAEPDFGMFQLRDDSPAYEKVAFERIPFEEMGLVRDECRPTIEDVRSALETIRPVRSDGAPGRARLMLRNVGDVPAEGVERVELKRKRHGPGIACVEVPFKVEAGRERGFEFDVALPADALRDLSELHVSTRGERVRPAWTTMPVAYQIEPTLELLAALSTGRDAQPGRIRIGLKNIGQASLCGEVGLLIDPPELARVIGGAAVRYALEGGAECAQELAFELASESEGAVSSVAFRTTGEGIRPIVLTTVVQHRLVSTPRPEFVEQVPAALAEAHAYPVRGKSRIMRAAHLADLRFAVVGEDLVVAGRVHDAGVRAGELIWDGSCVEVFGAMPDVRRAGAVSGEGRIGQVFLVPGVDGEPAKAYSQHDNRQDPAPDVRLHTSPADGGYTLEALIPLARLCVEPGARRFLLEAQVTAVLAADGEHARATLFGSRTAFNDTRSYGLVCL